MPFCPVCRDEFEDWVKVCPDDGVPLVAELPPEEKKTRADESLAYVATASNEMEAKMWEEILKERNIVPLLSTGSSALASSSTVINMPIPIYVLTSKVNQARKILAPYLEAEESS
jgi:hypothetical protein